MTEIRKTVGFVVCPIAKDRAEVRRDKRGKLYYLGKAGMIKPNNIEGQAWLEQNTEFLDDQAAEQVNAEPVKYGRRTVGEFMRSLDFQAAGKKPQEKQNHDEDSGLII